MIPIEQLLAKSKELRKATIPKPLEISNGDIFFNHPLDYTSPQPNFQFLINNYQLSEAKDKIIAMLMKAIGELRDKKDIAVIKDSIYRAVNEANKIAVEALK